jgi:hypothetical protein
MIKRMFGCCGAAESLEPDKPTKSVANARKEKRGMIVPRIAL